MSVCHQCLAIHTVLGNLDVLTVTPLTCDPFPQLIALVHSLRCGMDPLTGAGQAPQSIENCKDLSLVQSGTLAGCMLYTMD